MKRCIVKYYMFIKVILIFKDLILINVIKIREREEKRKKKKFFKRDYYFENYRILGMILKIFFNNCKIEL